MTVGLSTPLLQGKKLYFELGKHGPHFSLIIVLKSTQNLQIKLKIIHAQQKCPFTRHEISIGDPLARRVSNVILQCRGRKVSPIDSEVQWKYNGQIIKEGTNKKVTEKYLLPHETRKGLFSLHITNVSEKDVGKCVCKAGVSDHEQANVDEAVS